MRITKIRKSVLLTALDDVNVKAEIAGLELGHEEYVTLLTFKHPDDAARFLVGLTVVLSEEERLADILNVVANASFRLVVRNTKIFIRFPGWHLVEE